ncbi:MAG: hypothetical protein J4G15_08790 [Alphaproteobacteria bacterium]|nr:hypothetical protein [Alphaproteobacteria bacterium]
MPRWLKRPGRTVALVVLVTGAAMIAGLHGTRHEIAGWLISRNLGDAVAGFEVAEVTLGTVTMTNVVFNPQGTLEEARALWSLDGLATGHLDRLMLRGWKTDWSTLSEMAAGMTTLAADVVVEDTHVDISGPWGAIILRFDAKLTDQRTGLTGTGEWQAALMGLEGAGDLAFTWHGDDDQVVIDVVPRGDGAVKGAGGRIVVEDVTSHQPEARIRLAWPGLAAGDLDIEGTVDSTGLAGTASLSGGGVSLTADVGVTGEGGSWQVEGMVTSGTSLHAALRLDAQIADVSEPASWTITGDGVVDTADLRLGPWLAMEGASAAADLSLEDGRWRASLGTPIPLVLYLGDGLRLDLAVEAASMEAWRQGDGLDLAVALETSVEVAGRGQGRVLVRADIAFDSAGRFVALRIPGLDLVMEGDVSGHVTGSADVTGGPDAWRGGIGIHGLLDEVVMADATFYNIALDLPLTLATGNGDHLLGSNSSALLHVGEIRSHALVVGGVDLELPFRIDLMERGIEVRQNDTGWIDMQTFAHGPVRLVGPVSVKLEKEPLPLFVLEQLGNDLSWDLRLQLNDTPLHAVVPVDTPRPVVIEGVLPDLGIRLESLGTHYLQATMEAEGGDLVVRGPDLRIRDVRALLNYNSGLSPWPQFSADVRTIEDLRDPQRFTRMSVDVVATPVWPAGDDARLSMTLHADKARFLGAVDARYMPDRDRLEASVKTVGALFEVPGLQPADLSPLYGGPFSDVRGGVVVTGTLWFEGEESGADLAVTIDDVSARIAGVQVRHASGTTTFTHLLPLETSSAQTFTMAGLDALLPLHDVEVSVSWPGDGRVVVENAVARLPTGQPFRVEPVGRDGRAMRFRVSGLDAGSLLGHAGVTGLGLESRLDGEVEVSPGEAGLVIDMAELRTSSPGIVVFAGSEVRAYDALVFHYNRGEGTSGSMHVTMTEGRCRLLREFSLGHGIDALAGAIAAWMDDARCDST